MQLKIRTIKMRVAAKAIDFLVFNENLSFEFVSIVFFVGINFQSKICLHKKPSN